MTLPAPNVFREKNQKEKRKREDEEAVVSPSLQDIPMKQGVCGALKAAAGAVPSIFSGHFGARGVALGSTRYNKTAAPKTATTKSHLMFAFMPRIYE